MPYQNESSLKDAIEQFIKSYGLKDRYLETRVITEWPRIMGKTIAKHTTAIYVKNNKLIVHVDSAPLRQELAMGKPRLITLINETLDAQIIDDVIIR